jgi:hypothetical protein
VKSSQDCGQDDLHQKAVEELADLRPQFDEAEQTLCGPPMLLSSAICLVMGLGIWIPLRCAAVRLEGSSGDQNTPLGKATIRSRQHRI